MAQKTLKFASAQPAEQIYQHKKIKEMNGTNHPCLNTVKAATNFCINQELKFLYIKKST